MHKKFEGDLNMENEAMNINFSSWNLKLRLNFYWVEDPLS